MRTWEIGSREGNHPTNLFGLSQGKKKRLHGNDAVKSHILAARTVANIVKTSLV
jgi:hypothetical protein